MRKPGEKKSVTLDSDLQSDPADILKLLEYLDRYDMPTRVAAEEGRYMAEENLFQNR